MTKQQIIEAYYKLSKSDAFELYQIRNVGYDEIMDALGGDALVAYRIWQENRT